MLTTFHQTFHCHHLTHPTKLLHSSHHHHHRPPNNRIIPIHFSTGIFNSLSAIDKHKTTNQDHQNQHPDDDYNTQFIHLNKTHKKFELNSAESRCGILSNMWWADLKGAVGQRINIEGLLFSVSVVTRNKNWVIPHVKVPDVRYIDWAALKRKGFEGVVFDKDNTLTVPYSLALWGPIAPSVESCKAVFGDKIAVFSNSAGLEEYDPDGRKARALEFVIGIRVIRHKLKKPAGSAEEIEKHFGCDCSKLIMVGDRPFTDIVYGNRNGFLTILTAPLSLKEEPFTVKQVRKIELALVNRWLKKGIKPANERLLSDALDCVKEPPSV
ncbi:hypothetical protein M8C21_021507 [Ambrosia artemisiifolia]|uniref:Phosphatidylglycerophosphatase GEP4, mitochondrial n=1 Tax=Ambrosia artemisiifolia TaxID=4212 RepID=A0AAD5D832_AMBAR|nr:hypothetical protein M8C21_021507 [Ambrosia artemisiifolia]